MKNEWMKPWLPVILREAEDEGGGGAGYSELGDEEHAPAPDRTARLEQRLEKMASMLESFTTQNQQRERHQQTSQLENQIKAAELKAAQDVDRAQSALAEAYDEGDGQTIAKAQRVLSEAAARRERVNVQAQQYRDQLKASERKKPEQRDDLDTTNLDNWKSKHSSWYGVDKDMTKYAHDLDARIRENGVLQSGSKEYFDAIDRQMRQRFPDRFDGTPPTSGSPQHSGGGSGGHTQQRIPASVAEGYRRMGLNVDDPAVAKRMIANREKAVAKGWLPEKAVSGRILTR